MARREMNTNNAPVCVENATLQPYMSTGGYFPGMSCPSHDVHDRAQILPRKDSQDLLLDDWFHEIDLVLWKIWQVKVRLVWFEVGSSSCVLHVPVD